MCGKLLENSTISSVLIEEHGIRGSSRSEGVQLRDKDGIGRARGTADLPNRRCMRSFSRNYSSLIIVQSACPSRGVGALTRYKSILVKDFTCQRLVEELYDNRSI